MDYDLLKYYGIDVEMADYTQEISISKKSGFVLLDIEYGEEYSEGWIEDNDGYELLGIRQEILSGDYRSLFAIWLRFLQNQ